MRRPQAPVMLAAILLLAGCAVPAQELHWDSMISNGDHASMVALIKDVSAYPGPEGAADPAKLAAGRSWLAAQTEAGHGSAAPPALLAEYDRQLTDTQAALEMLAYARVVAIVDGGACKDQFAAQAKLSDLLHMHTALDSAMRALPAAQRQKIIDAALAQEARTWPLRSTAPSAWLCSGGLQQTAAGQVRQVGTNMHAPPDAAGKVAFQTAADWASQREGRRSLARQVLRRWAGPQ